MARRYHNEERCANPRCRAFVPYALDVGDATGATHRAAAQDIAHVWLEQGGWQWLEVEAGEDLVCGYFCPSCSQKAQG